MKSIHGPALDGSAGARANGMAAVGSTILFLGSVRTGDRAVRAWSKLEEK